MDSSELLKKIHLLELQIDDLKSHFPPPGKYKRRFLKFKKWFDGALGYWAVWALLLGLAVNWYYNVGVFQTIKNTGVNNTSSDYYYRIGERLMERAQFEAAHEAFSKALVINPSNADARKGLMKTEVFQPVGGSGEADYLVVENKLNRLSDDKIFGERDYILLYWKGLLRRRQTDDDAQDLEEAKRLFRQSIEVNDKFLGSYFEMGNTFLHEGKLDEAVEHFKTVYGKDKRYAPALKNLGYCNLVLAAFEEDKVKRGQMLKEARETYLEMSDAISPRPETKLHLGDSYLFDDTVPGNFRTAKVYYENALEALARLGTEDKSEESRPPALMELPFVYLPDRAGEERNRNTALTLSTVEDLKAMTLFSLSIASELLNDRKGAEKYFSDALALRSCRDCPPLIANKINVLLRLLKPEGRAKTWLEAHAKTLDRVE